MLISKKSLSFLKTPKILGFNITIKYFLPNLPTKKIPRFYQISKIGFKNSKIFPKDILRKKS